MTKSPPDLKNLPPLEDWERQNLANMWHLLNDLGRQGKLPPVYGRTRRQGLREGRFEAISEEERRLLASEGVT